MTGTNENPPKPRVGNNRSREARDALYIRPGLRDAGSHSHRYSQTYVVLDSISRPTRPRRIGAPCLTVHVPVILWARSPPREELLNATGASPCITMFQRISADLRQHKCLSYAPSVVLCKCILPIIDHVIRYTLPDPLPNKKRSRRQILYSRVPLACLAHQRSYIQACSIDRSRFSIQIRSSIPDGASPQAQEDAY